jgi:hypothetical protein
MYKILFYPKGLFRTYFIKDGKKLANIFQRKENGAIHKKFRTRKLDIYNIDTWKFRYVLFRCKWFNVFIWKFSRNGTLCKIVNGYNFGHFMERIKSMRFTTAKEKYNHFVKYHDIHHRIPLGMVFKLALRRHWAE